MLMASNKKIKSIFISAAILILPFLFLLPSPARSASCECRKKGTVGLLEENKECLKQLSENECDLVSVPGEAKCIFYPYTDDCTGYFKQTLKLKEGEGGCMCFTQEKTFVKCYEKMTKDNCDLLGANTGYCDFQSGKQCAQMQSPYAKESDSAPTIKLPDLLLQVPIGDLSSFSAASIQKEGSQETIKVPWLALYIGTLYKYLVGIAGILAAAMIVYGGLKWMLAAGNAGKIGEAKESIGSAVIGLLLALFSYLLLWTINPQLVNLKTVDIETVAKISLDAVMEESEGQNTLGTKTVCPRDDYDCLQTLCNLNKAQWPKSTAGMASPDECVPIVGEAIRTQGSPTIKPEVLSKLQAAALDAKSQGMYFVIGSISGYRPLEYQIKLACNKLAKGLKSDIGSKVAWPGGSNHGSGVAVDISVYKDGKLFMPAGKTSIQNKYESQSKVVAQIMEKAGFVRYCAEIWHFEIGTEGQYCRRKPSECPWPPGCK